jgi:hypothetical protein
METTKSKSLMDKNGMKIIKLDTDEYNILFSIKNNNFILPSIINFDLIKLIFDLNPDIYEKSILHKNINISENNATIGSLMKDVYSDLGIPQTYICMNVEMSKMSNIIRFTCNPIDNQEILSSFNLTPELYLLPIKSMTIYCNILTNHHIDITCQLKLDDDIEIEQFIEKIIISVINKIFIRLKQFIEKLSINNILVK